MSAPNESADPPSSQSWQRREQILLRFEQAWVAGQRPNIDDFVPQCGTDRLPVLVELVYIDLDYQLKTGGTIRVESYLHRYPELAADSNLAVDLILAECDLRQSQHATPSVEEYCNRFPQLEDTLRQRFAGRAGACQQPPHASRRDPLRTGPYVPEAETDGVSRFAPGMVLKDRYLLDKVLGQGGMGQVFLGRDTVLNRSVAVKVILPLDPELRNRTLYEGALRQAFAEEARLGANLTHPAIATVYDFGFHDEAPFTVFEYIPGETLRDQLKRRGRLPLEEVRLIVGPLAQALDFAHGHHVVHRDLKPENIRATAQGQFKILDLGLAKEFRQEVDWRFAGTPAYASPEQAASLPCDGRTDQYALALIAFELLSGHRLFQHPDCEALLEMQRSVEPIEARTVLPELPSAVSAALTRAWEKEPNQRFTTCEELALAMGCQLLSAPVPVGEILRLTALRNMSGQWRSARFKITRRGVAVYLGLAADALWVCYRGEIGRWPLQCVTAIERSWWGSNLHLRIASGERTSTQSFAFGDGDECRQWYEHLMLLRKSLPEAPAPPAERPRVDPVVLLRQRPLVRYQLLGTVEAKDKKSKRAEVGLQIRGAMIGADAVVEVQKERLPEFGQTVWRFSGTAVRAVDAAGRRELRSRWFASEVARIGSWMIWLIAVSFAGNLLGSLVVTVLSILSVDMQNVWHAQLVHWVRRDAGLISLIHGLPLIAAVLFRLLQWPQLGRPAALAILALGARPLASWSGLIAGTIVTGRWSGTLVQFLLFLDPVNLSIFLWSIFLSRRAWHAYQEYRVLVPDEEKLIPKRRRAIELFGLGVCGVYSVLLAGFMAWSGYTLASTFISPQERWMEGLALQHLRDGVKKMGQRPNESEKDFLQAQNVWKDLAAALPGIPGHRQNLAATYYNLALLFSQTGRLPEAEDAYLQALGLYTHLVLDYPGEHGYEDMQQQTQRSLAGLRSLKPLMERIRENQEIARLVAAGRYTEAKKVLVRVIDRQEKLLAESPTNQNYQHILAGQRNALAWFLVMCPDVRERNPLQAVELAKKAVAQFPKNWAFRNTLGAAHYRAGNWQKSLAALEKAMQQGGGGNSFDYFFAAMAHQRLGHSQEARQWLSKATLTMTNGPSLTIPGKPPGEGPRMSWTPEQQKDLEQLRLEAQALVGGEEKKRP
jgi:tetratricopeptide (TPR) repeat protein